MNLLAVRDGGYREERRRETLARLRWAALLALVPLAVGALANSLAFSDRLEERLAAFALEAALCLVTLAVSRGAWARRQAVALALAFIVVLDCLLVWQLSLSPGDADVLVGPVAATMMATALLFPWGGAAQGLSALFLAAGYFLSLPRGLEGPRITNILISLVTGAALSVIGAVVLDRHRLRAFRRSAMHREEAEISAALLEVSQEVNARLDRPDLLQRVTRLAVEAVGCDWCTLCVWDEGRRAFRLAANTGWPAHLWAEVDQLEFARDQFPIGREARPGEVIELADSAAQDLVPREVLQRWHISSLLAVPMARAGDIIGSVNIGYRERTGPFSDAQRRVVRGIAHATSLALQNAQLIAHLQAANRLKSEFVSTMSHELRTPLHVILGFTEMLRDPALGPAQHDEFVDRVEAAGRELLRLIESTLEVGRLEAGRETVNLQVVALPAFWAALVEGCAGFARAREVALEWAEEVPDLSLITDPHKLGIVMRNLVGNALKFTERGFVRVTARVEGAALLLAVADSGIGIDPEDHAAIFEMFR
jgi:signal transduction histidine kinase